MRILLTSILCKSGMMTHVLDLAQGLSECGVEVGIAFKNIANENVNDYESWLERLGNVQIFRYASRRGLGTVVDEFQPQLIHAHSTATFIASAAVAERNKTPFVLTLHSTAAVERWYPSTLRSAKKIIAVGPAQVMMVPNYKYKTVMIPNGIDLKRFNSKRNRRRTTFRLCWFGRVHGMMAAGVASLNQALVLLREEDIKFKAYLVGSADWAPKDNFIDVGWLDDPVSQLQKTDIAFGHGRALREAMACGNIGFLLGAGYGGMVTSSLLKDLRHLDAFPEYNLPPAKPEKLAADLLKLIKDPGAISALKKEAKQIARDHFSLESMVTSTTSVYAEILRRP